MLITSDNTLRAFVKEQQLEVYGHLWVFDRMMETETITGSRACEKLSELCEIINPKLGLPKAECAKRIKLLSKLQMLCLLSLHCLDINDSTVLNDG